VSGRDDEPPAGPQGQPAGDDPGASSMPSALERRYRRLLAWYPAGYRSTYGDEMVGVLMAAAPAGRDRPGMAETLNLIRSGLGARLRAIGTGTDPAWRDALAVYSLAAPLLLAAAIYQSGYFLGGLLFGEGPGTGIDPLAVLHVYSLHLSFYVIGLSAFVITMASLLAPVILSLLRLRRTAILVAAVVLGWATFQASLSWRIQASNTVALLAALAVGVAALAASDGPRRALRLLNWKGVLMAVPWVAVAVAAYVAANAGYGGRHFSGYLVLATIIWMAATLASAKVRRLLLLFAIPIAPFVVLVRPYDEPPDVMYLAPALLSLVAFFASRRSVHGRLAARGLGKVA
jgi:hypothetical protein